MLPMDSKLQEEDSMWHKNSSLCGPHNLHVSPCNVPILIIAYKDNSINPTNSLGLMDTFGILIREIINDVQTLEWNKYLIMEIIK